MYMVIDKTVQNLNNNNWVSNKDYEFLIYAKYDKAFSLKLPTTKKIVQ